MNGAACSLFRFVAWLPPSAVFALHHRDAMLPSGSRCRGRGTRGASEAARHDNRGADRRSGGTKTFCARAQPRRPRPSAELPRRTGRTRQEPAQFPAAVLGGGLVFSRRQAGRRGDRGDGIAERFSGLRARAPLEQCRCEAARDGADHRDRPRRSGTGEQTWKLRSNSSFPGDVVRLSAGDMIPADVRVLSRQGSVPERGVADRGGDAGREIGGNG